MRASAVLHFATLILFSPSAGIPALAKDKPPKVTRDEVREAKEALKDKTLRLMIQDQQRVETVGFQVLRLIPLKPGRSLHPYWGITILDASNKYGRRIAAAMGLADPGRPFVYSAAEGGPAWLAGVRPGDLVAAINDVGVRKAKDFAKALERAPAGRPATITLVRRATPWTASVVPIEVALDVRMAVFEQAILNAFAGPGAVLITSGMAQFLRTNDELSVVLGHELAHLSEGHLHSKKKIATGILGGVLGAMVPGLAGIPGQMAIGAMGAKFSRDDEREADFVGLQYAHAAGFDVAAGADVWERMAMQTGGMSQGIFDSHPNSPERMVQARKVAERLKQGLPPGEEADAPKAPAEPRR